MTTLTFLYIFSGTALVWISAQKLEKYSVLSASKYGMSPFLIGSTVIAFGTSAPEMLTSLFAALDNKAVMVVGNVIGSNVANIALVFGITLGVLFFRKEDFLAKPEISLNLIILILSTLLICIILNFDPFNFYSSITLLAALFVVIVIWYKTNTGNESQFERSKEKYLLLKLLLSLASLVIGAYLITDGALNILETIEQGELIEQSNMKKLLLKAKHQVLIIESIDKLPENIAIENCDCEIIDDHTLQVFQGESTSISDVVLALSTQNINVSHLRSAQNRLEALFLSLTN